MTSVKIAVFAAGLLAFLIAVLCAGSMLGQVFWQAGMAIMAIDIVMIMLWPERPDWIRRGHCVYCGYDLKDNTAGRCPECGKEVVWRLTNSDHEVTTGET